jgi:hypothetical protein
VFDRNERQWTVPTDSVSQPGEVGGTCGTNGRKEERLEVIGRTARGKETTRKTETKVDR